MVYYIPVIVRAHSISRSEWGSCIVIGASTLIVGPLLKKLIAIVDPQMKVVYKLFDERTEIKDNKVLSMYNKVADTKIPVGEDQVDNKVKK